MVFIRRVRTASGATAVQIAEYAGGRQRIVKNLGSAHTEAELGLLLEQARGLLEDPAQASLELGVERTPRVAGLLTSSAGQGTLDAASTAPSGRRDGAGRVVSTDSRLLFDVLCSVFTGLGFDALEDLVFRDLVLARMVEPTSLLDTGRVLQDLSRAPVSYATMKPTLKRCLALGYRDQIAAACFAHALTSGDVSSCLYDVTTLHFEAEKEDDGPGGLRKVGYSKERRVDRRSWSGCWSTGTGSRWRSAAFKGTRPRRPRSSQS